MVKSYDDLLGIEGIEKISIEDRKWSNYIKGAMALIRNHPDIHAITEKQGVKIK
jgi:hypothetical protein